MTKKKVRELNLSATLTAIARKDRDYYRNLTEKQKSEFSAYVMQKYASDVRENWMEQICFLASTNNNVNLNLFTINRHPELQWLTLTTVNPVSKSRNFGFIKPTGSSKKSRKQKILEIVYPEAKTSDLEILSQLITDEEINDLASQYHIEIKN